MTTDYATTMHTTTLYSVAQRSRESREYLQVLNVGDRDQAIARMTHYGVERRHASDVTKRAFENAHAEVSRLRDAAPSASAMLALPAVAHGEYVESDAGPYGETFRVVATVVSAPGIPVA